MLLEKIDELINNKQVLILGFGKEGQSTYHILRSIKTYKRLDIADRTPVNPNIVSEIEHMIYFGDNYMDRLDSYDIVFKSPGIVLPKNIGKYKCIITSQTDVFLSVYGKQIVGITGTKGKSTVSTLIYHILFTNGINCLLAGNIGTPVFDIYNMIKSTTIIVLELSCHQLEYCQHSPRIAVLLNIYEDHLDHYGSFAYYAKAKSNIYKNQLKDDILFCGITVLPEQSECVSQIVPVSFSDIPIDSLESITGVRLCGRQNLLNCAFAVQICKLFGISLENFISSLQSYHPLPHRLEFVGRKNGVDFYDDSISTTVESTINAIQSIPNTKVILLGGMDRGIDYSPLVQFLLQGNLSYVILMYESGKRIFSMIEEQAVGTLKPLYAPDLAKAIKLALKYAEPGSACILSPASASYGDFKNFEERGEVFKRLVLE